MALIEGREGREGGREDVEQMWRVEVVRGG
jgi:hypothetical protein